MNTKALALHIQLLDVEPPVWRRILVSDDTTLYKLHQILQAAMGWMDSHLYQFIKGDEYYGTPDPNFSDDMLNAKKTKVSQLLQRKGARLHYEYDFGDGWMHEILVLNREPLGDGSMLPLFLEGENACPPEDCGGTWGYEELLKVLADKKHPEHKNALEWLGEDFDPKRLDLPEIHQRLKRFRPRAKRP